MKRLVRGWKGFALSLIAAIAMSGCSFESDEDRRNEAAAVSMRFLATLFGVEDFTNVPSPEALEERLRPFVTDEVWKQLEANRIHQLASSAAISQRNNIGVDSSELSDIRWNDDGTSAELRYGAELQFVSSSGVAQRSVRANGDLTIADVDGEWRVTRFYLRTNPFLPLLEP
ncbi:hypothetical protein MO973_00760 [Paenibacillus sp. TRM 82003]|nr:hypothetical protein [Paenibacillus sp. TRM 82003]